MTLQQRKERVALLSVISNAFLVIFKLIVGVLIASVAIMSEAPAWICWHLFSPCFR